MPLLLGMMLITLLFLIKQSLGPGGDSLSLRFLSFEIWDRVVVMEISTALSVVPPRPNDLTSLSLASSSASGVNKSTYITGLL